MPKVSINCDISEAFGIYRSGEGCLPFVTHHRRAERLAERGGHEAVAHQTARCRYGMTQRDPEVAEAIADAAKVFGAPMLAFANPATSEVFTWRGIPFVCEFYSDLDYNDEGRNIITREHHAVSPREVGERVRRAVREGRTRAVSGKDAAVVAESVCVHSDTPGAVEIGRAVRQALEDYLQ